MACVSFIGLSPIAKKPQSLNIAFCDHEGIFEKPDLLRSVTPPPSLSPTRGQIKRFQYTEHFANVSVDDTAISFIKEYKKSVKKQKTNYEAKLKETISNTKNNKAVACAKSLRLSPEKFSNKFQKLCKKKVIPKHKHSNSLCIPSLPLHKINRNKASFINDSIYEDNRYAIGWNFLNHVTKQTLLSDNSTENIDNWKSFVSHTSMILTFNHYTKRWQTSKDIRKLSTMTTNRYRKEGIAIAANIVDKKNLNMNTFVREYPNISHKRFKKSLRTCYQILDNRPATVRTTMHSIPLFLPSLNITFDPSVRERRQQQEKSEHNKRMQRKKFLLERKKRRLIELQNKVNRLKEYKKELRNWQKTKRYIDIDANRTPFASMMNDKNRNIDKCEN
eukprot:164792_1